MQRRLAIHTSKRDGQWINTREGSTRVIGREYDSQGEAATAGRRLARQERVEHVSHRADGLIDEISAAGQ